MFILSILYLSEATLLYCCTLWNVFWFITFVAGVSHHRRHMICQFYEHHGTLDRNINKEISSIIEINRSTWKFEKKKIKITKNYCCFVRCSSISTYLFEQIFSSGTHSQGCCGISPSESLIQWYNMHRAHFIAVVYSRLALKQSGANSQAPFRLNSSVKNSWQYLNMMIFFYHYSYIIMDNKSLNQIRIEWVCEQFQYVCPTCTS